MRVVVLDHDLARLDLRMVDHLPPRQHRRARYAGIVEGLQIGLPPIINFGSKALQDKVCGPCLRGEKIICLCITEPTAGSDVANIRCTAKLSEDKTHYVVSGEKK